MKSKNPQVQRLMDEVDAMDENDQNLEVKLQRIAEALAAEQRNSRPLADDQSMDALVDPQDAFACEGCQ